MEISEIIVALKAKIDEMKLTSEQHYAANNNRLGNLYCDGAPRLERDLASLTIFDHYFKAMK